MKLHVSTGTYAVWLLPWHVMTMRQDSGLTRQDTMTAASWELGYCISRGLVPQASLSPTDAYHG